MSLAPSPTASVSPSGIEAARRGGVEQRLRLPSAPTIGSATVPASRPPSMTEPVGDDRVEADRFGDAVGEAGEAARHEQAIGAVRAASSGPGRARRA